MSHSQNSLIRGSLGCFHEFGVLFICGCLVTRALLLGVSISVPDFWKLPYMDYVGSLLGCLLGVLTMAQIALSMFDVSLYALGPKVGTVLCTYLEE